MSPASRNAGPGRVPPTCCSSRRPLPTGSQRARILRRRVDRADRGDVVGVERSPSWSRRSPGSCTSSLGDRGVRCVTEHSGTGWPCRRGAPDRPRRGTCARGRAGGRARGSACSASSDWHGRVAERHAVDRDREVDAVDLDVGVDDRAVARARARVVDVHRGRDAGGRVASSSAPDRCRSAGRHHDGVAELDQVDACRCRPPSPSRGRGSSPSCTSSSRLPCSTSRSTLSTIANSSSPAISLVPSASIVTNTQPDSQYR